MWRNSIQIVIHIFFMCYSFCWLRTRIFYFKKNMLCYIIKVKNCFWKGTNIQILWYRRFFYVLKIISTNVEFVNILDIYTDKRGVPDWGCAGRSGQAGWTVALSVCCAPATCPCLRSRTCRSGRTSWRSPTPRSYCRWSSRQSSSIPCLSEKKPHNSVK